LWHDQYQRPLLDGARLNCVPDLTDEGLGPDVKGIISGEGLAARSPGRAAFTFKPVAAHAFGCNALPETRDKSAGFWRRWLVLTMNRSFQQDAGRDVSIHKKIIASDLPAIVRWALRGAARLAVKNEYTIPPSSVLALERWRGGNDAVRLFIETRTRATAPGERGTCARELHAAFTEWAHAFGTERTETAFGRELAETGLRGKRGGSCVRYAVALLRGSGRAG
jgi:putative DNA primase/helicase